MHLKAKAFIPPGPAPTQNTIKDYVPLIVSNETLIEDSVPTIEEKDQNALGRENIHVEGPDVETNTNGSNIKQVPSTPSFEEPEIFEISSVQEPASFPGGNKALLRFMESNLRDPGNGEPGETIRVQVKFVIGKDGQAGGFTFMSSSREEYDKEVLRVLRKMPRWKPARLHNQQVAMFFIMPVSFASIDNE